MKKAPIALIAAISIVLIGAFYFFNQQTPDQIQEQQEQVVLEQTFTT